MKWFNLLLIFLPTAVVLEITGGNPTLIFVSAALAILPLAGIMGQATEQLAVRAGSTIGGLLNATFGNATELIIAFFALQAGKLEVVKASIIGSILGNLLLVLGLAMLLGGLKYKEQKFSVKAAGTLASLLTISLIALSIPTIFDLTARSVAPDLVGQLDVNLSEATAVVLIIMYVCYIFFTLRTHKDILSNADEHGDHDNRYGAPACCRRLGFAAAQGHGGAAAATPAVPRVADRARAGPAVAVSAPEPRGLALNEHTVF